MIAKRERYIVSKELGIFPENFKKYVTEEKLLCWKNRLPGNTRLLWAFEKEDQHDFSLISPEYRRVVDEVIRSIVTGYYNYGRYLIQFWRAEEIVVNSVDDNFSESRFRLAICNQPFLLRGTINDWPSLYRMKMHNVIVRGDGRGGAIGRAFQNNRMEFTPNVSYYSDKEYPQRKIAKSCNIVTSLVVPWHDSSGRVVGAIECVSPLRMPLFYRLHLYILFEKVERVDIIIKQSISMVHSSLVDSDRCVGLCGQYILEKDSLMRAVSEIKEVIKELGKRGDLVCARTWMLCKHCTSISTSKRFVGEPEYSSEFFIDILTASTMLTFEDYYNPQKCEGVVGKAANSSHDLVYCKDVTKFSIIEYPLAHLARYCRISSCFAICLRSNHTGDQVYVLELFPTSSYVKGKNLGKILLPILEIMRQLFKTFRFASGREIEDNLSVQVIDSNSADKVETLKNGKIDLTLTPGLNIDKAFDSVQNLKIFGGQGESSRPSFPQRSIGESSTQEADDPIIGVETFLQDTSMEDAPVASASTVQCEIHVTIKATYGVDSIRFHLSASSGIHELYRQVSQKLQLVDETFDLKYQDDENDFIELRCDEDLQMYISISIEQENYILSVFVFPR